MRNLLLSLAAVVAIAACGPSGRDLGMAKAARYQGDKLVLFGAVKSATESKQQVEISDETTLTVKTKGRWHTPEGLASNWSPGDEKGGQPRLQDRSLNISYVVRLLPERENWIVHVDPTILEYRQGKPNFDKLAANDPSLPGWASGKGDQLAYEIYKTIRQYEVKTVPGMAPPANGPTIEPTAPPVAPTVEPTAPPAPAPASEPVPTP